MIPKAVIPGMTFVSDKWILHLDPFYQDIFRTYTKLAVLAHGLPSEKLYPRNLWASRENKCINKPLVFARYVEVTDLPVINGSIDFAALQMASRDQGSKQSVWLLSISLQEKFKYYLGGAPLDREFLMDLIKNAKNIYRKTSWTCCALTKWEIALGIPPIDTANTCLIFKRMVKKVKISKLRDNNFKILHRIMATPYLISKVCKEPKISKCFWCDEQADLNHILLGCSVTQKIHNDLIIKLGDLEDQDWIFGTGNPEINQIIMVVNYELYKVHILAVSEYTGTLENIVDKTLKHFAPVVRAIRTFDLIS